MRKPIKPMDDYRDNRPMLEAIELCNQILELIEDLNEPRLLRFDDITIVSSFGSYNCYGDECYSMVVKIYTEEKLDLFIDKISLNC